MVVGPRLEARLAGQPDFTGSEPSRWRHSVAKCNVMTICMGYWQVGCDWNWEDVC